MTVDLLHRRPDVAGIAVPELAAAVAGEVRRDDGAGPVTGASVDSANVAPGEAFFALPGFTQHGAAFAAEALAAGARVIVTDEAGAELIDAAAPLIVCPDPRQVLGRASALIYGEPAAAVDVVGVTGTNGKTTTTTLLHQIFTQFYARAGVFGTVEVRLGADAVASPRTTLEAPVVQRLLALGRDRGVGAVAMEVSSHAIALGRVRGLRFAAVAFLNLQSDHLDFHHTMAEYFEAKAALFTREYANHAVICVDDEWGRALAERTELEATTVATVPGRDADVVATDIEALPAGTRFTVRDGAASYRFEMPLTSRVMVQNALVAIQLARQVGVPMADLVETFRTIQPAAGRMQTISERDERGPLCMVDYAHTPEALEAILPTLRAATPGRLIIVFGSDGDRDPSKRAPLGAVAARLADELYVTDENPRTEDPAQIRGHLLTGVRSVRPGLEGVSEWDDRRAALTAAVAAAGPADTVVATGKGPEPYQEIDGVKHSYNDAPVMLAALGKDAR